MKERIASEPQIIRSIHGKQTGAAKHQSASSSQSLGGLGGRFAGLMCGFREWPGEMKMKTLRISILGLCALLLTSSWLRAHDFSEYRGVSLGATLASTLQHTGQKSIDVTVTHARPVLLQELTWWPANSPGAFSHTNSVEQILFSFCNGELYKISVTYDHNTTEGLTAGDMIKAISTEYGPATNVAPDVAVAMNDRYATQLKPVASWEDSQFSFNLVRSSFTDHFGLVIFSKRVNAEAERGAVEAVKLDEQEGPQREALRLKKEADDLEAARLKNQKAFRP